MTIETFLRKLKALDRKWRLDRNGMIRSAGTCPVKAVAGERGISCIDKTGMKLGLTPEDTNDLWWAADNMDSAGRRNNPLRKRMLRALKLKERTL